MTTKDTHTYIAIDPGTTNLGCALIETDSEGNIVLWYGDTVNLKNYCKDVKRQFPHQQTYTACKLYYDHYLSAFDPDTTTVLIEKQPQIGQTAIQLVAVCLETLLKTKGWNVIMIHPGGKKKMRKCLKKESKEEAHKNNKKFIQNLYSQFSNTHHEADCFYLIDLHLASIGKKTLVPINQPKQRKTKKKT